MLSNAKNSEGPCLDICWTILAVDSPPWWTTVLTAIAGGAVAVIGGLAATFWVKHLEIWRERMEFASALSGELETILDILVKRDYLSNLEHTINHMEQTQQMTPFQFSVRDSFFAVYLGNISKIGVLPGRLPARVSRVYGLIFSTLEDMKFLNELEWNKAYPQDVFDHVMHTQKNLLNWGRELITDIEDVLPRLRLVSSDYSVFP
jgi:hypothetical protein